VSDLSVQNYGSLNRKTIITKSVYEFPDGFAKYSFDVDIISSKSSIEPEIWIDYCIVHDLREQMIGEFPIPVIIPNHRIPHTSYPLDTGEAMYWDIAIHAVREFLKDEEKANTPPLRFDRDPCV
jgi:hypothetical protein